MRALLFMLPVALSACAEIPLWHRTPEGQYSPDQSLPAWERVPLRDPSDAVAVNLWKGVHPVSYGVTSSRIPEQRVVELVFPNNHPDPSDALFPLAGMMAITAVFLTYPIIILGVTVVGLSVVFALNALKPTEGPKVVKSGDLPPEDVSVVAAQELTEEPKVAKPPAVSWKMDERFGMDVRYASALLRVMRNEDPLQERVRAGFLHTLGRATTAEAPQLELGVKSAWLLRTAYAADLTLLLCSRSYFRERQFEACQATRFDAQEAPRLADDAVLGSIVADAAERLGRLHAKAMTTPVLSAYPMKVTVEKPRLGL